MGRRFKALRRSLERGPETDPGRELSLMRAALLDQRDAERLAMGTPDPERGLDRLDDDNATASSIDALADLEAALQPDADPMDGLDEIVPDDPLEGL